MNMSSFTLYTDVSLLQLHMKRTSTTNLNLMNDSVLLDHHQLSLSEICKEIESVDLLKNKMVWLTVDLYCQEIVIYNETFQPA